MIRSIILTAILFISVTCLAQKKKENIKMAKEFYGCWTSSYEENDQKTKVLIYRPCGYKQFKASMYRHYAKFEKDGKCTYLQASPTDAHFEAPGTWVCTKKKDWVTILNDKNEMVFKFKIKSIGKDKMEITVPD